MIKFIRLEEKHLKLVMTWRANPEVAKYLFTNINQNIDEQYRWFNKINIDDTYRCWIIDYNGIPIGFLNLAAIDRVNLRCNAGYYIGELEYRSLGALILPYLYNYVFKVMCFKKIYGEVIAENSTILKIHEIHGYRQVGIYKEHVLKNGIFHDTILIELLAESWLRQKRYQQYVALFD
jgi:UDP-4-amino-4,6-dideoxy-N-acetyl-beta-L-altrosamine N-acetyltransferase